MPISFVVGCGFIYELEINKLLKPISTWFRLYWKLYKQDIEVDPRPGDVIAFFAWLPFVLLWSQKNYQRLL